MEVEGGREGGSKGGCGKVEGRECIIERGRNEGREVRQRWAAMHVISDITSRFFSLVLNSPTVHSRVTGSCTIRQWQTCW